MTYSQSIPAYRKRYALTQDELASLLSITQSPISRLEDSERTTLETALGLQVIFDVQPRKMFHRLYHAVEDRVMAQAALLDEELRGRNDPASQTKQRLLASMVKRAKATDAV